MELLNKYLELLLAQAAKDAAVLDSRWMYTGVLLILYVIFAAFKWYVLLTPITLPITVWRILGAVGRDDDDDDDDDSAVV